MAEPDPLNHKRFCPICRKPSQRQFHPFCSSRCSQVDLNRWLGGQYALPTNEAPHEGEPGNEPEST